MPYCIQADVETEAGGAARLIQLTDWDNNQAVDTARVDAAIAKSDALIDSFCSKRFTVPFNPVPVSIKLCSAELAVLNLRRARGMREPEDDKRWTQIAGTAKGEEGWLHGIATGVVTPGGDPLPAKHSTMVADRAEAVLPEDRDTTREKTAGLW